MFCNNPFYERPFGIFVTTKQTIDNASSIFLVNNVLLVQVNVIFFVNIIVDKKIASPLDFGIYSRIFM